MRPKPLTVWLGAVALAAVTVSVSTVGRSGAGVGMLPLRAPRLALPGPLLGFAYGRSATRLARIDPRTLRVLPGHSLRVQAVTGWAVSPDRRRLAVATCGGNPCRGAVRLLAMPAMRPLAAPLATGAPIVALAWVGRTRLLALVGNWPPAAMRLLVIDPGTGSVVARYPIVGTVLRFGRTRSGFVLLTGPKNAIGPATLQLASPVGVRAVALARVGAGLIPGGLWNAAISDDRFPALALDPTGRRAFVIDPAGTVAVIELDSFSVSYHRPRTRRSLFARLDSWLEPAAQAKGDNGPWRQAQWLGNGLLAVAGSDWHGVGTNHGNVIVERLTERPSGLQIIDSRDWTVRTLDPNADSFTITNGLLLATGTRWDVTQTENHTSGEGLIGYDTHGKQRFHLFAGHAVTVNETFAERAYVTVVDPSGPAHQRVVDLRTGRTVKTPVFDWPELLLGNGGPSAP